VIFFATIVLGPSTQDGTELARRQRELTAGLEPLSGWLAVSDPWSSLDLSPFGYRRDEPQTWTSRSPGPVAPSLSTAGPFEMVKVTDERTLAEFEAVHNEGFGAKPTPPGTYYGPGLLDDPRMHLFLARYPRDAPGAPDGGPGVGTAMAYVSDGVIGVYSVSVIPRFRGRGIGWALTREAVEVAPVLDAVLQPSAQGRSRYRRMGFEPFAEFAVWVRPER
jgi:GNAT superfamily N-acetyltransferase